MLFADCLVQASDHGEPLHHFRASQAPHLADKERARDLLLHRKGTRRRGQQVVECLLKGEQRGACRPQLRGIRRHHAQRTAHAPIDKGRQAGRRGLCILAPAREQG